MSSTPVVVVTDDQRSAIHEGININEKRIEEDIHAVLEWYKKQQHLPRIELDPRIIKCILISRKGSVEQTKQKIDMMYSLRNVIPEMAATRDVFNSKITNALKGCNYAILPKLNKDYTRVSIIQYGDVEFFNVVDILNYVFTTIEYRLLNDCFAGDRYVFDFTNLSLGHITKYTPSQLKHIELYIRKAYGIRIFGLHVVNGSSLVNRMITLFKSGFSEKISSRIYVHESYDDLYKVVNKDILPVEYGGQEQSVEQIGQNWKEELSKIENRNYLISQEKFRSNENLRIGSKLDEELMGVAGSFRKLDVD